MAYVLYKQAIQDGEDLYTDLIEPIIFPLEEEKYYNIVLQKNQDLFDVAILVYNDIYQWKMLAILNNIEDPMLVGETKIRVLRPSFLKEVVNGKSN